MFSPFEISTPHVAYACLGGFVVLFGMFSLFIRERLYVGEACCAFLFGVIIGPYAANIFNPRGWAGSSTETTDAITLEFTRVVLAVGVFAIGVELPKAYMFRHWKSLIFLLVPVMTWGWFVSAGLIYAFIPGLNFLSSLAVAACLTPTDPILAAAVVGGRYADKHVPAHLRHLLAAESGCNDGAAFPFLYIALYLILDIPNLGKAFQDWLLIVWFYDIILGIVIGTALGISFRYLMKFCQKHDLIDRQSYVAQYLSLALLTIGLTTILGTDDLLAAFACGSAFAWDGFFNRQTEESVFSSVIDLLFNVGTFIYVGAWMPFSSFRDAELTLSVWRLLVIAILVLLLRRLPIIIALYRWIPDIKTLQEAVFSGHFGPIGIGAIFISTLATEILHNHSSDGQTTQLAKSIQPIVAFMVLCSIVTHGLSIPFFSLGRHASRTWSRHASIPDWTNQIRHVVQGADIIINRDGDIEKGFAGRDEKADRDRPTGFRVDQAPTTLSGDVIGADPRTISTIDYAEALPDSPPDGNEHVQEWREGKHQVIERKAGPGEEVEVQVLPESSSNKTGSAVHETGKAKVINLNEPSVTPLRRMSSDDVEDVEWDSDQSQGDTGASSSNQITPSNSILIRPHSHKRKTHHPRGTTRARRRSFSHKSSSSHGDATVDLDGADSLRGRVTTVDSRRHSRPSTAPNSRLSSRLNSPSASRRSSVRNLRLEHIIAQSTRENSPSRSIRFVDDENRTPKSLSRTTSQDLRTGGSDDTHITSERNQVTFELPPRKP